MVLPISPVQTILILWCSVVVYYTYERWIRKTVSLKGGIRVAQKDKSSDEGELDLSGFQPVSSNFDWKTTPETPYRPWHNGPHHVTMGLKQTTLEDWVEIDKTYLDRYQYKRKIFAEHPEKTVQFVPGSEEPSFEALYLLVEFLPRRYPSMFAKVEHGIRNLVTDENWDLRRNSAVWKSYHPLQVMGLLTTEDWFIMQSDDDQQTRLKAGANCFPAGWKIQERIGHSLWQIHAGKVPHYEQKLSKSMDRFFLRLRIDSPIMRFNYAIDDSPELFHIHSHHNLSRDPMEPPLTLDQLYLRVERQYLQRLPKTRAIVFSIRTFITPISEVTKDREVALALRTQVASYSDEVAKYKNKTLWNDVLTAHIDKVLQEKSTS